MPYQLTDAQQAYYSKPSQALKVYFGITEPFVLETSINDPNAQDREEFFWNPVVIMGPNTVAWVGEPIPLWGGDSYGKLNGGSAISSYQWRVYEGDPGATYNTVQAEHTFQTPGHYGIDLKVTDAAGRQTTGRRFCRVYERGDPYVGVAELQSLGGSLSRGGWGCSLKVTGDVADSQKGQFKDRAGIVVYAEDYYEVSRGSWQQMTMGVGNFDPHILFAGYIVGDTIRTDAQTHDVTFQAQSAEVWLQQATAHSVEFAKSSFKPDEHPCHHTEPLTFADAILHILQGHTNFAWYHDVHLWQNGNELSVMQLNEGNIWQWCLDFAQNEFGSAYCDRGSALHLAANPNMRGMDWWGSNLPPVMDLNLNNLIDLEVSERPSGSCGYVQLNATARTDVVSADGAITSHYPQDPLPTGSWEIVHEILIEDKTQLDILAKRLFYEKNARYTARATAPINHVFDVGQVVTITHTSKQ